MKTLGFQTFLYNTEVEPLRIQLIKKSRTYLKIEKKQNSRNGECRKPIRVGNIK